MPLISDAELDYALQGLSGESSPNVRYGAQTAYGVFVDNGDIVADMQGGFIDTNKRTLTLRDGAIKNLVVDTPILVGRVTYRIRDLKPATPGLVTVVLA